MKDSFGRNIDYMRVSLTDRCNLSCSYCKPERRLKDCEKQFLSLENIFEVCCAAAELGIDRFKITGGEPLLRDGVFELIKKIKAIKNVKSVTLTTNGVLAESLSEEIHLSGVDCVNISLDSLDKSTYFKITGQDCLREVLRGIDALFSLGVPLKINTVLQRGINDGEVFNIAALAKDRAIDVRFIELMPIGYGRGGNGILNSEVRELFGSSLSPCDYRGNGPAVYFNKDGFLGRIGFISPLSSSFCKGCRRIRLTSTGFLKGCLCYDQGCDLTKALKHKNSSELKAEIKKTIFEKPLCHCFKDVKNITENKGMSEIGG